MHNKIEAASAYLYLWPGKFLYIGNSIQTKVHGHHALQIAVSTSKPFRMKLSDQWEDFHAVVIKPDHQHECILEDKQVFFFGLDPESSEAVAIQEGYLQGAGYRSIDAAIMDPFIRLMEEELKRDCSPENISAHMKFFIEQLSGKFSPPSDIDQRLRNVIAVINNALPEKITLKELAAEAFLSESRLIHLFKEQIGIPIRVYILWNRLIHAVFAVVNGATMTEAAYTAGFADSAHFSRIFARMLGTAPTGLLKNSQNVQAYICTP